MLRRGYAFRLPNRRLGRSLARSSQCPFAGAGPAPWGACDAASFVQVPIFGGAAVAPGWIERNEKLYAEGSIRINEWTTAAGEKRRGSLWRHGARRALALAGISGSASFRSRAACRQRRSVIAIWCVRLLADTTAAPARRSEAITTTAARASGARARIFQRRCEFVTASAQATSLQMAVLPQSTTVRLFRSLPSAWRRRLPAPSSQRRPGRGRRRATAEITCWES
jgi:hypothetical protein